MIRTWCWWYLWCDCRIYQPAAVPAAWPGLNWLLFIDKHWFSSAPWILSAHSQKLPLSPISDVSLSQPDRTAADSYFDWAPTPIYLHSWYPYRCLHFWAARWTPSSYRLTGPSYPKPIRSPYNTLIGGMPQWYCPSCLRISQEADWWSTKYKDSYHSAPPNSVWLHSPPKRSEKSSGRGLENCCLFSLAATHSKWQLLSKSHRFPHSSLQN